MRSTSIVLLVGLGLAIAACTGTTDEEPGAEPGSNEPSSASSSDPTNGSGAGTGAPSQDESAPPAEPSVDDDDGAAAAPLGDGGTDAAADASEGGVKVQIPIPKFGKLYATNDLGQDCAWTVGGIYKTTGKVLDIAQLAGSYDVTCKTAGGAAATKSGVIIAENQTTTIVVDFPAPSGPGTLVGVAVGGTCAWTVNGASKGTASEIKIALMPGAYTVGCKPDGGATKTRNVIIKSGETAMAMFTLSE